MSNTPTTVERRAYTIAEFLQAFRIGRTRCNELMRDGVLVTRHFGKRVLIDAQSAEAWFNSLPKGRAEA